VGGEWRHDIRRRARLVRRVAWALFRPASLIEDDSVRSEASLIFNARRATNSTRPAAATRRAQPVQRENNQIEYYYLSRLPGEPIGGVADRHVHPAEPLAVRLTLAGRF